MKKLIAVLTVLLISLPVSGGERVTKVIESDIPIIIDGNWVYPENGKHTLVLTDSVLTVNGYEYVHPPKKIEKHEVSKERNFSEWLILTAVQQGQAVIDNGGSVENAFVTMRDYFDKHLEGNDSIYYEEGKYHKGFAIKGSGIEVPRIIVPVPRVSTEEKERDRPTWREKAVEGECKTLVTVLKSGRLLFKNTIENYSRTFDLEKGIPAIRKIQSESLKYIEASRDTSICVDGIKFSRWDIEILANPRKLVRRRFTDEGD